MNALLFRIISGDASIAGRWTKAFQKEGWAVACGETWTDMGPGGKPSELALIEIGSPECRVNEDLKNLLKTKHPVSTLVFGDQQKTSNTQIAAFLEAGADDFVYKNLDERVLVAKLKAHIRRIMPMLAEASAKCASCDGDIKIDSRKREVKIETKPGKHTEVSNLTQKEFDILTLLVGNEKQVVTREAMLEKIWGTNAINVYSECIDKHIESLRKKLGFCGKRIRTVYGAGYMFSSEKRTEHA